MVAVGAFLDDDNGTDSGSIYVYTPSAGGGYDEVKLTASDGMSNDRFGTRLSINENGIIAVGAPGPESATSNPGAVYVYTPDGMGGYSEVKLTASDGGIGNYFGNPAYINDNGVIFVGASSYYGGATTFGAAYLYTPDGQGGYTESKLLQPDPESSDYFGNSGAVNATGTVVVSAFAADSNGTNAGAFYVYEPDGNGNYVVHKILPTGIAANDLVGRDVEINDSGVIVVGADSDDDNGINSGSAFVYVPDGNGSYSEFKLTAHDGSAYDYFGFSVSINNDGTVSFGANKQDGSLSDTGAVYTFIPNENGDYVGADGTVYQGISVVPTDMGSAALKITGSSAGETLVGGEADDTIDGQLGNDTLTGAAGDDVLTGGTGSDTFVFGGGDTGHDTVTDFTAGAATDDLLSFETSLFADYAAVLAAATDVGSNTVITIDANTSIELQNVQIDDLHQDDFLFV
ncbi:Poly(beta-D-mannuronate) C5 epimerase 2 [Roseibium album]|nr:Poly(beta-D-mannuronate) C5 epimerase 2 [Roseibium album]